MRKNTPKHNHSDTPERQDMTVTCSEYYRLRAAAQRRLKSLRALPNKHNGNHDTNILEAWRKANNLSQEELSQKSGISIKEIIDIERGRLNSSMKTYIKLSKALRVNVVELINIDP